MSYQEKKKKAIAIAVAYFVEQEKLTLAKEQENQCTSQWQTVGRSIQMRDRQTVQRKGRSL